MKLFKVFDCEDMPEPLSDYVYDMFESGIHRWRVGDALAAEQDVWDDMAAPLSRWLIEHGAGPEETVLYASAPALARRRRVRLPRPYQGVRRQDRTRVQGQALVGYA